MTFPNPEGVIRCIRRVLADADVVPDEIGLINGHLTSTKADLLEVQEWRAALGLPPGRFPRIQSTKSMIGHALGAAGALEAAAVVDQLARGYVHPSINCENVHPEIAPIEGSIVRRLVETPVEVAIKASFGFGDVNGCLLFRRWNGDWDGN
jgi:3-oxoacyl-(acyl-carrier-protein) synthase